MPRFYPGSDRKAGVVRTFRSAVFVAAVLAGSAVQAQTPASPSQERPPLGSWFTVDALGRLPVTASVFPLLSSVADVIPDRIDTGGLSAGSPAREGTHGETWTQTVYRVGDADITNLSGTGTPLLMPGVDVWERVDVNTGMMPIDVGAPGMAVSLAPRRPAASMMRAVELFGSPPFFNAGSSTTVPPSLERLNSHARANLFIGGPLMDRVSGLLSANWIRSSYSERDSNDALTGSLASAFANVTATPRPGDEVRVIGWGQRTSDAIPHHVAFNNINNTQDSTGLHLQAAWQHVLADDAGLRLFGSYTLAQRSTDFVAPSLIVAERLRDGPIPTLLDPGIGTDSTWSFGVRLNRTIGGHNVLAGADMYGGGASQQSVFSGRVGELLNGVPARVWDFTDPVEPSKWSERALNLFVSDRMAIAPRVTIDGGLRFETIAGSAAAQDGTISWTNLLPRAGIHWTMLNFWELGAFGSYARYGHRLPLTDLAYGDPTAPTASIYRWNATTAGVPQQSAIGPLIQRLGPGTGGVPGFSAIDPALKRPHMDEAVLGFDARPSPRTFLRIAAIGRLEKDNVSAVDVGVPESTYSTIAVPDTGIDVAAGQADQILIFYNRSPATFGADRYLLTNPAGDEGSFVGADMIGQVHTEKFFYFLGLTAGRSEGIAANRGFGPLENDTGVIGDAYIDPNSLAHAQGRTFTERGYTIKTAGTYTFPHDITFGVIGRYQDGQHFARLVILPDLNQGPEAVRAFRNGRTRFTFEMTVDARIQKGFTVGGRRADLIVDAYNLFNEYLEVEEITVSGPTSRQKSASQPPRAIHFGIRVPF
ncbi:MAG TPA: TonB-dependent receptor [Vicinamibacterales bacterium]|nr:TonB-dependent receptor [Vicinamibacterales bacterium]